MMKYPALRHGALVKAQRIVPYLTPEEVKILAEKAAHSRKGERNYLLILIIFQTGLRMSEALNLSPSSIEKFDRKPLLSIVGKGKKRRLVACPERLVEKLKAHAFEKKICQEERFLLINRFWAWQILRETSKKAMLNKRVFPHLLRHSDAIERLRQTGNSKALQLQLGHSSTTMTMRYLSTLTQEDAVRINQEVVFDG
jgi:integrase/recombinase XerD